MSIKKTLLIVNLRDDSNERIIPFMTAKKLGLNIVLLTDHEPGLPKDLVDYVFITDTYQMNEAIQVLQERLQEHQITIDGVTTWGDRDVELVAKIGQHFGVPALHPNVAKNVRNKYFLREALSQVEGLSPRYHSVTNEEEFWQAISKIGFPCVFKPAGLSGSTAIFVLNSEEESKWAYQKMLEVSNPDLDRMFSYYPDHYIIEEYLDGPEFSVEGLVHNHEVYIAAVTDKWTTEPYKLEIQHIVPSGKPSHIVEEIKQKTMKAIQILGLNHCPFHLECKFTSSGMRVVEVAGRAGGDLIASHLVKHSTGIDFHEQIILNALGLPVKWEYTRSQYTGIRKIEAQEEGMVTSVSVQEENLPTDLLLHNVWVKPGDQVLLPPKDFFMQMLGYVLVEGNTYEEVQEKLRQYADFIQITVQSEANEDEEIFINRS